MHKAHHSAGIIDVKGNRQRLKQAGIHVLALLAILLLAPLTIACLLLLPLLGKEDDADWQDGG